MIRLLAIIAALALLLASVATAQIAPPLPATITYETDGQIARIAWMDLGPLDSRYVTNSTSLRHEGDLTIITHELVLRRHWRVLLPVVGS